MTGEPASGVGGPSRPKVSVVIPTRNRKAYLAAALESVFAQTLANVEVIVVDDGSTDGTEASLRAHGDRLRYLRVETQGVANARNVGMEAATGQYIAWCDDDDLYRPFKLAAQVAVLDHRPDVGFVYSEMSGFDDAGFEEEWHLRQYHVGAYRGLAYDALFPASVALADTPVAPVLRAAGHADWLDRRLYVGPLFEACLQRTLVFTNSILFRRELFAATGPQQRRFGHFHDYEFVLRMSRLATAAFLDVPTYRLRYHPQQVSTSLTPAGKAVTIRKQRDLLFVLEAFLRADPDYYAAHRADVDRQRARLHRAIAVPMLALTPATARERRRLARRARHHLARAAAYGVPDRRAWALSYVPKGVQLGAQAVIRGLRRIRHGAPAAAHHG